MFTTEYEDDTGVIEHLDSPRFKCKYAFDEEQVDISGFTYTFTGDDGETDVNFFGFSGAFPAGYTKEQTEETMRKAYAALTKFTQEVEEVSVLISLDASQDDSVLGD